MRESYKRSELAKLKDEFGFNYSKSLGQNFLTDRNIIENIADALELSGQENVVEIGAGAGAMTTVLSERAGEVFAIEIDRRMIPVLENVTEGLSNVRILNEDFLKIDGGSLPHKYKLVGNLPYYITTPIIAKVLEDPLIPMPEQMVFMMQKEVGERLMSPSGKKSYGAISVLVQYYCEVSKVCSVPRTVFVPSPNVDSIVLSFVPKKGLSDDADVVRQMFAIVKAGFSMRRKTLRNSLASLGLSEEVLLSALSSADISPERRAETLSPDDFLRLAKEISAK
ncbi:MAG: 16S rRNA (adenine(1518)-N(6)/adenine(1519)-N(6))-dimethyltransferase RsmA [Clostridiales Family XIII bacterium]|jgi:16S rRNA (adenine1518-N6/adenine1519-N6)-dimethyltransferase|nr:16S rRNA (adenine(1518)-N(6)/adenine(1519)-N(6))-dimethyltransferase RsmA [Clostridiales Family XIII bacterium]